MSYNQGTGYKKDGQRIVTSSHSNKSDAQCAVDIILDPDSWSHSITFPPEHLPAQS